MTEKIQSFLSSFSSLVASRPPEVRRRYRLRPPLLDPSISSPRTQRYDLWSRQQIASSRPREIKRRYRLRSPPINPSPKTAAPSLLQRVVKGSKPLKSCKKPLKFVQKGAKIGQQVSAFTAPADQVGEACNQVKGVFTLLSCLETLTSIEQKLNEQGLSKPTQFLKPILALAKGLTSFTKWMDEVGVVALEKIVKKNLKIFNLWNDFCSSLISFSETIQGKFSYKKFLLSGWKVLSAAGSLANAMIEVQLIAMLLKPLDLFSKFFKAGCDLKNHYVDYHEGKDSGGIALLRVGKVVASVGLAILALGVLSSTTGLYMGLSLSLSVSQLTAEASLYYYDVY